MSSYIDLTNRSQTDSSYLRSTGLKPNITELCTAKYAGDVLDIGSADGWLSRELPQARVIECDVTRPPGATNHQKKFVIGRLEELPFRDGAFGLCVASLVLMWLPSLDTAYRELRRVTSDNGRLVIAIVHPSYYRTGHVASNGDFVIERSLAESWSIGNLQIGGRGRPFTYHHHRYDSYLMTALAAGWRLESVRDWFIDIEDYHDKVNEKRQIITRTGNVPLYSFLTFEAISGL